MTGRGWRPGRKAAPRSRTVRGADPYGLVAQADPAVPLAALVGLVLVAVVTLALFTGTIPFLRSTGGPNGGGPDVGRTPVPSNVVVVDPRADIPGMLVYVKQGNLWLQSGTHVTQITASGTGSMPAWSPDGSWIYYVETVRQHGRFPVPGGGAADYDMDVPYLTRVRPDGTGQQTLLAGLYHVGSYTWFSWIRGPAPGPDLSTVALFSDAPDPTNSDVVLQFFDLRTKKLTKPAVAENAPLGHQDAAWRPDGKLLLYVMNGRDGTRGAPIIYRYDPATKRTSPLSGPGYMRPSWSPDGRWVAATRQTSLGTDVAILDATTGTEVLRLTADSRSWAPTWSPRGDAIAYLHLEGQIVDLKMIGLTGIGPTWKTAQLPDATLYSGLDAASGASWFIPADQLPTTPAPASASPAVSPAAGGSAGPVASGSAGP